MMVNVSCRSFDILFSLNQSHTHTRTYSDTSVLLRNIDSYKEKCFTGAMKQYASLFIYSNKNSIKRFCSRSANKKRVDDLLKLAPCVNTPKVRQGLVRCMNHMVETFVGIKYAADNRKIGHLCWLVFFRLTWLLNLLNF